MFQSRTHNCGELRIEDAGKKVTLVGWMENVREVGQNFAFVVLRDFYGTTQIVVDTEDMMPAPSRPSTRSPPSPSPARCGSGTAKTPSSPPAI
jgi:aspartyl/asparaginyl-tRNA synthetase